MQVTFQSKQKGGRYGKAKGIYMTAAAGCIGSHIKYGLWKTKVDTTFAAT